MACSFYPSLAAGNEFAQERDLGHPLQVRPLVSKWALLPALARCLRGRANRSHVILDQTLREWTRFNLEE